MTGGLKKKEESSQTSLMKFAKVDAVTAKEATNIPLNHF